MGIHPMYSQPGSPESGRLIGIVVMSLTGVSFSWINQHHKIIFTFEWNQPIAWTPYDLLAWLQFARSNGTIHPIFETREVEGQKFDLPDFGTVLLAESLNSRIKMIKVKSRGYRNKERFITDIYFHLGGLDLYPEGVSR